MFGKKLTDEEIVTYKALYLKYLDNQFGIMGTAVAKLKEDYPEIDITWDYYQLQWRKKDMKFEYAVKAIKNLALSQVENVVMRDAMNDVKTAQWVLSRRHPDYSEKVETTVTNNNPVQLSIIAPNDGKAIDGIPVIDKKELGEPDETN